jgi:hypothetical protein
MYNITVGQLEQNTDIINLCLIMPNQNMGLNDINSGQVFNIILTSVSDNN